VLISPFVIRTGRTTPLRTARSSSGARRAPAGRRRCTTKTDLSPHPCERRVLLVGPRGIEPRTFGLKALQEGSDDEGDSREEDS